MWENAYLSIKNQKASRALKGALDPGHILLALLRWQLSGSEAGPPLTKSWIYTWCHQYYTVTGPHGYRTRRLISEITITRVATAQGKQGIWFLLFPDRENTGNFALTQGKILRHRENIFL